MANMSSVILLLIVAVAYLPRHESAVIRHELEKRQVDPENAPSKELHKFRYDNDDNSYREEVVKLLYPGTEDEKLFVVGQYGFQVDGNSYVTKYTAGDNGYIPVLLHSDGSTETEQRFVPLRPIEVNGVTTTTTRRPQATIPREPIDPRILKNLTVNPPEQ